MIIDIGPILYAVVILYALAGTLFLTLLCTGIWAARKIVRQAKRKEKRIREASRTPALPYRPIPQTQNR